MQIAPAGDRAFLIQLGDVTARELHAAAAAVRATPGVIACIIGHASLYVICSQPGVSLALDLRDLPTTAPPPHTHRLAVRFDRADLDEFLVHAGLSRDAFLARITDIRLTARYLGFRAGFAYLDGWPAEWRMPRRPTSRPVARGSFAIAGAMAGFYPIDTPGGWNLLGHTAAVLWDPSREPPNLIAAGDEIEIVPTDELVIASPIDELKPRLKLDFADVLSPGQLTLLVREPDWRRIDHGLPPGGPFDERAATAAMRAAGADAALECALVGPLLRFRESRVAAWAGAAAEIRVNGSVVGDTRQFAVNAGDELAIGRISGGLRGYLAVGSGGTLSADDQQVDDRLVIRAVPGPHDVGVRGDVVCTVTPQLDRVGIRLTPLRALEVDIPADLSSCGMQFGTVQLHPDRSLVAMGPEHPVTGGYLQPVTVLSGERWKLGQLMPGERVTLRVIEAYSPYS